MKQIEDTDAVKRIMSASVVRFSPDQAVLSAIQTMVDHGVIGGAVVDDYGNVVGALTHDDCVDVVYKAAYHDQWDGKVSDFMNKDVTIVDAARHVSELPDLVMKQPYPLYPVVEEGRLIGQITPRDILRTLLAFANKRGWTSSH